MAIKRIQKMTETIIRRGLARRRIIGARISRKNREALGEIGIINQAPKIATKLQRSKSFKN